MGKASQVVVFACKHCKSIPCMQGVRAHSSAEASLLGCCQLYCAVRLEQQQCELWPLQMPAVTL